MRNGVDDPDIDQFEVVKYPALAITDEYLAPDGTIVDEPDAAAPATYRQLRLKGEALHPSRYSVEKLNKIRALNRKDDGSDGRWWSALYQQNPVPDDGGYFMKSQFKRAPVPAVARANVYIAWDFAISEKKQNDYTVGAVGLQDDDDILHVAEIVRFKSADSFFIVESILNLCARWSGGNLVLGFEDGQIWRAIEALLRKRMRERRMYPAIEVLKPITDKLARARPLQGRMQQGMVSFSLTGEWYDGARAEMLRFPAGVHDDQVDALAWMTKMAVGREAPRKLVVKPMKSWKDKLKLAVRLYLWELRYAKEKNR
jgi:predicted phage terminase large subunit-like protein